MYTYMYFDTKKNKRKLRQDTKLKLFIVTCNRWNTKVMLHKSVGVS